MSLDDFQATYVTLREEDGVTFVTFTLPELTDDENVEQLGHELFAVVEQYDRKRVVLDMRNVEFVTSAILGKLITLHRKLHRADGTLAICNLREAVYDTMLTSRLVEYFHVAEDVPAAVEMLKS